MKYVVKMNNQMVNGFEVYSEARELMEKLEKMFKTANIEIVML